MSQSTIHRATGRILIVEDEPEAAGLLSDILGALGYESRIASRAADVPEQLRDFPAHIALVDLRLGDADGLDLISELKLRHPRMEIIVVTGRMDQQSAITALRSGVYDYLVKPVNLIELRATLARCFEKQRLESANADALEALTVANEATTSFLANMSHELRTPLNAIIGFASLLHTQLPDMTADQRLIGYAADIEASGQLLLSVVNDILDFARIESDGFVLHRTRTDIEAALHEIIGATRPNAAQKGLALTAAIAEDLPAMEIDRPRIVQALRNLMQNAVKYTPDGGAIELTAQRTPNGGVDITIRDTGIGMTADELRHAITPFAQVETAETRSFDGVGLGLGLPMTARLIEAHGGRLLLDSKPGAGTAATLCLPAELRDAAAA